MKTRLFFSLLIISSKLLAQINIMDLGAIPDGKTLNTNIIQQAIDSCSAKGGGKVFIPKGRFLTGSIE